MQHFYKKKVLSLMLAAGLLFPSIAYAGQPELFNTSNSQQAPATDAIAAVESFLNEDNPSTNLTSNFLSSSPISNPGSNQETQQSGSNNPANTQPGSAAYAPSFKTITKAYEWNGYKGTIVQTIETIPVGASGGTSDRIISELISAKLDETSEKDGKKIERTGDLNKKIQYVYTETETKRVVVGGERTLKTKITGKDFDQTETDYFSYDPQDEEFKKRTVFDHDSVTIKGDTIKGDSKIELHQHWVDDYEADGDVVVTFRTGSEIKIAESFLQKPSKKGFSTIFKSTHEMVWSKDPVPDGFQDSNDTEHTKVYWNGVLVSDFSSVKSVQGRAGVIIEASLKNTFFIGTGNIESQTAHFLNQESGKVIISLDAENKFRDSGIKGVQSILVDSSLDILKIRNRIVEVLKRTLKVEADGGASFSASHTVGKLTEKLEIKWDKRGKVIEAKYNGKELDLSAPGDIAFLFKLYQGFRLLENNLSNQWTQGTFLPFFQGIIPPIFPGLN